MNIGRESTDVLLYIILSPLIVFHWLLYDSISSSYLGQLKPEGEAPLLGGLLMGLAGVNGGATSQIMEIEVPGHMIIFTDGTSAQVSSVFESNPSYFTRDFRGHAESGSVITLIAGQAVKIFYVPIGENTSNATLEFAVAETGGKIIPATEIYRLIRITQVMLLAARVASAIRFAAHNQNRDVIRRKIAETERTNVENVHDDSVDMVLEFVNPLTSQMRRGMYRELNYRTLKLGDRVRRGSYWPYGDQDTGLPGTVVGQNGGGSIWVEWDNSHINHYVYNEEVGVYSLRKVNEKRILFGEMIGVGCRVIRGIDWKFDNYDGGVGSLGTVLCVRKEGTVVVRWDCKSIGLYKIGCNNLFEVQVYDNTDSDTNYLVHNELFTSQTNQPKQWKETDQSFECPSDIQYTKTVNETKNYFIPLSKDKAEAAVRVVWEYQEATYLWKQYPKDISLRIEKAYQRKPEGKTIIKMDHQTYIVHFTKMIQEDPQTKEEISVRRLLS